LSFGSEMRLQADATPTLAHAASALVEERLDAGRAVRFTIPTASMWPTLAPGDRVLARGAQVDELRVGDIIIGKWGEDWRAHRLIERRRETGQMLFVTQGDNCGAADPAWPASQLVGVVASIRRGEREVNLQSGWARRLGAGLAFLLRRQNVAQRAPGKLPRRAALKGLRVCVRAGAWLARWVS
jgi:hypothetical protein